MICDVCKNAGQKSRVTLYASSTTTMAGSGSYYDEDGRYHLHNPNTITTYFTCSNGHEGRIRGRAKCPSCDYAGEDTIRYTSQPKEQGR